MSATCTGSAGGVGAPARGRRARDRARARLGEDRFLDVHHRELVADPLGTVRRIYDALDLELTPSVAQAIFEWHEATGPARTALTATPEQFGLTRDQLRSDYDFYIRHFDIGVEG